MRPASPILAALGMLVCAAASAQDGRLPDPFGIPYHRSPTGFAEPSPAYDGPSPFAIRPAYGMSGLGYYYDQPSEHRLGPVPDRATGGRERRRRAQR